MKRLAALSFSFLALALASAAGSVAAKDGSYGPWEPTYQGAITAPAGLVCPFQVTASPVEENMQVRYHYDAAGNIDGYQGKGKLIAQITNDETGATVQRNLSGPGTVVFNPDGSYDAVVDSHFLVFFRTVDNPANELLYFTGRTVLHGAPGGEKTLVSTNGRVENLCETLA